jgi:hypothetical protein
MPSLARMGVGCRSMTMCWRSFRNFLPLRELTPIGV